MKYEIGPQYNKGDQFKAAARLHQSRFRAAFLKVDFDEYGNRLNDDDGKSLLNYYEGLNVRDTLRARYPEYSKTRDADMLRSEHIPFNMFGPMVDDPELAKLLVAEAFGIKCRPPFAIQFEWAPKPRDNYLGDATAFDVYIKVSDESGRVIGIGV